MDKKTQIILREIIKTLKHIVDLLNRLLKKIEKFPFWKVT